MKCSLYLLPIGCPVLQQTEPVVVVVQANALGQGVPPVAQDWALPVTELIYAAEFEGHPKFNKYTHNILRKEVINEPALNPQHWFWFVVVENWQLNPVGQLEPGPIAHCLITDVAGSRYANNPTPQPSAKNTVHWSKKNVKYNQHTVNSTNAWKQNCISTTSQKCYLFQFTLLTTIWYSTLNVKGAAASWTRGCGTANSGSCCRWVYYRC